MFIEPPCHGSLWKFKLAKVASHAVQMGLHEVSRRPVLGRLDCLHLIGVHQRCGCAMLACAGNRQGWAAARLGSCRAVHVLAVAAAGVEPFCKKPRQPESVDRHLMLLLRLLPVAQTTQKHVHAVLLP